MIETVNKFRVIAVAESQAHKCSSHINASLWQHKSRQISRTVLTHRHFASFSFNWQQKRHDAGNDGYHTVHCYSDVDRNTQQHLYQPNAHIYILTTVLLAVVVFNQSCLANSPSPGPTSSFRSLV